MTYNCKIINIDEEEVTLKIGNACITGFVNCGLRKEIGEETTVDIILYDDLKVTRCDECECKVERKGETFQYSLFGTLDIANAVLKSIIDFKIDVLRIDFDFI